jgi:DNA-binding MarR family transcriptional regulator
MSVLSRQNLSRKKSQLTLADYQSLAELRHQIRCFLHFSEEAARNSGIEPRQHQLMLALKGLPDGVRPRVGELAERLQIKHHSAVELVNRLASGGYVRRIPGEQDRREVLLSLTSKGEKILRELSIHHKAELKMQGPALVEALERAMHPHGSSHLETTTAKGKVKRNQGDARN